MKGQILKNENVLGQVFRFFFMRFKNLMNNFNFENNKTIIERIIDNIVGIVGGSLLMSFSIFKRP